MEIRPAILAKTETEFIAKLNHLKPLGLTLHIDVMDNIFVPNQTWNDVAKISTLLKGLPFEAHLMTKDPINEAEAWLEAGAIRAIIHRETIDEQDFLDPRRHALAINPTTKIETCHSFLLCDVPVMLMGVKPGADGQKFDTSVMEKISLLKKLYPHISITIDGGVKPENIQQIHKCGADIFVVGSYLAHSTNLEADYLKLIE